MYEYEQEIEQGQSDLLLREAFAQGLPGIPRCDGAVSTGPGAHRDYPAYFDYDPCEEPTTGFYGPKGWLCDQHAAEAGVL